jgi:hypothetical protein
MAEPALRRRPPFTILLVAVLGVALGAVGIAHGVGLITGRDDTTVQDSTSLTSGQLVVYGIGAIALGVIIAVLSVSLARGSRFARFVVGLFAFFHLVQGFVIVFQWYDVSPWEGVSSIILGVAVLLLLFGSARSREFYASGSAA